MILKNKNGGIIKLQHAGIMPSVSLQQIIDAASNGDIEKADLLKKQFQLEQAKRIYADNNGEEIKTTTSVPYTGVITQGRDKLYRNAYDRWTTNTANGQEFRRFVDGPLKFAVENGLLLTTGLGTATRLAEAGKLANGISTASKVAPLWQDLAYAGGTSYFATQGLNGLKQDIWGKRKFNPLVTAMDVLMATPAATVIKPTAEGMKYIYNSGNMWMRALRGEPNAMRRVKRFFNPDVAERDYSRSRLNMEDEVERAYEAGQHAKAERRMLGLFIKDRSSFRAPLTDFTYESTTIGDIPSVSYSPIQKQVEFKNPITGEITQGVMAGERKAPDWEVRIATPRQIPGGLSFNYYTEPPKTPISTVEKGSSREILENDDALIAAITKYRDMVNAKARGKALVGGSVESIAERLHSGLPNDTELYTRDKFLDDIIKEFKITVTDRSPRRIKGTSPYAINGQIDVHTLDPNGPDVEELGSLLSPEEHAAKRTADLFRSFRSLFRKKARTASRREINDYFRSIQSDPSVLTDLMRKNNLQGIGSTEAAQEKFARRQTEMGLRLPLEDLDRTFDQIEAQIPGFVTFGEAYPNFDYTNIEGNKAFLRYFGLPEHYATDIERMKRLYRQQHTQFTPSIREFNGARSMAQAQRMGRKNAQYNGGSASGGGGNMLISARTGGFDGDYAQNTAAQYLPTYHPEQIITGADYVDAIEKTKLFGRKITPEEDAALVQLLGPNYFKNKNNLSDVLQEIAEGDLNNPRLNKTIQQVSRIIDVPRLTGVRYGGTNAVYVGNLSGEPISETFTLGRPFEFGRSFNDVLAPPRDGVNYGKLYSFANVEELPLEHMPKSNAEVLRRHAQNLKDLSTDPRATAKRMGLRYVDTIEDAQQELKNLEKIPIQKIDGQHVRSRYAKMVGDKLYNKSNRFYNLKESLGIGAFMSLISGGIGALVGKIRKDNKKAEMRIGWHDDYFKKAYQQSPEYFPYSYEKVSDKWTDADWEPNSHLYENETKAWNDWYNKNKAIIEHDWKERRPIRREDEKRDRERDRQLRAERKAKEKEEKKSKKKNKE